MSAKDDIVTGHIDAAKALPGLLAQIKAVTRCIHKPPTFPNPSDDIRYVQARKAELKILWARVDDIARTAYNDPFLG